MMILKRWLSPSTRLLRENNRCLVLGGFTVEAGAMFLRMALRTPINTFLSSPFTESAAN